MALFSVFGEDSVENIICYIPQGLTMLQARHVYQVSVQGNSCPSSELLTYLYLTHAMNLVSIFALAAGKLRDHFAVYV